MKRPHYNFYLEMRKHFQLPKISRSDVSPLVSHALLTTHCSSKIDGHKRQWEDTIQELSSSNKNFYVISVELHFVKTSCTDQSLLSKKNKLLIFQVTITASAASDIEVSTDRFVLSTETVSKRSTVMKNAQPHLPNVSTSESATAIGDIFI